MNYSQWRAVVNAYVSKPGGYYATWRELLPTRLTWYKKNPVEVAKRIMAKRDGREGNKKVLGSV